MEIQEKNTGGLIWKKMFSALGSSNLRIRSKTQYISGGRKEVVKMIKLGIVLVLVGLLACGSAAAKQKGIGVEYVLGERVGISWKISTGAHSATAFGTSWSFDKPRTISLHLDYLVYANQSRYYGVGLGASHAESEDIGGVTGLMLRFPIGFEKRIPSSPIAFFGEMIPVLDLIPASAFRVSFTLGVRYLFL